MPQAPLSSLLLKWFDKNKRDLPWRKNKDPYAVWISEIMLQQTQVDTVIPFYTRWMKAFPDIAALAHASPDAILKHWEGLGYYTRVRNLHKAAEIILEKHKGIFPEDFQTVLSLPGIGRYTSGAILSIAFDQKLPVLDGNVMRVFARLFLINEPVNSAPVQKKLWKKAEELMPSKRTGDYNQSLMELGALICTPKNPQCALCPLQKICLAKKEGSPSLLPVKTPKTKIEKIRTVIALLWRKNKIFIQKRKAEGFLGGLWEFPGGKVEKQESEEEALQREIKEELGIAIEIIKPRPLIRHAYTRFQVTLYPFDCKPLSNKITRTSATEHQWVKPQALSSFAFPAANKKLIQILTEKNNAERKSCKEGVSDNRR